MILTLHRRYIQLQKTTKEALIGDKQSKYQTSTRITVSNSTRWWNLPRTCRMVTKVTLHVPGTKLIWNCPHLDLFIQHPTARGGGGGGNVV